MRKEKFRAVTLEVNRGVLIMVCGCPNHISHKNILSVSSKFYPNLTLFISINNFIYNPVKKENLTDHKMAPNSILNWLKSTKIPLQMKMC